MNHLYFNTIELPGEYTPTIISFDMRRYSGAVVQSSITHPDKYTLKVCLDCGEALYINVPAKEAFAIRKLTIDINDTVEAYIKQVAENA